MRGGSPLFGFCQLCSNNRLICTIVFWFLLPAVIGQTAGPKQVLIVVGPSSHPPGTHEVGAGARVIAYCAEHAGLVDKLEATIVEGWPTNKSLIESANTIVFSGDRFPLAEMPETERNMAELKTAMERGCGIVCFHYATGLTKGQMPDDGSHPLLDWMGGYFATRCVHHQSVAKIFEAAKIELPENGHPILRGCQSFTIHDEPYIKNYFGPQGIAKNVTPLATSMLPPEDPHEEIVAWATQRENGGR
ncbi:MAG: hypothetical protein KDB03_20990, partial [Planctomycetales bacterium]|nr:hypothetical protein [Planctomycetales bacterium]